MDLLTQILIFAGLMLALLVILQIFNIHLNDKHGPKVLLGTAIIVPEQKVEGMENYGPNPDLAIDMSDFHSIMSPEASFCHSGGSDLNNLDLQCNKLTKENCGSVSCCGYLNNTKCVSGTDLRPTFLSDKSGKPVEIESYYYMNKCIVGPGCSK